MLKLKIVFELVSKKLSQKYYQISENQLLVCIFCDIIGNMMCINELVKNLIFTSAEIGECFEYDSKAVYWAKNAVAKGRIAKIRHGLYSLINPATGLIYPDKFMLGSNINKEAYIAYHGALEFHGYANQVYNNIYVATAERFASFEHGGITYERVQSNIPDGVITIKSSCDIRVTDLERTLIDCIYDLDRAGGAEELLGALSYIKKLDYEKLLKYLTAYDKNNLWQKTAYLFEQFNHVLKLPEQFFDACLKGVSKRVIYFLNNENYGQIFYNKKWNVMAPVSLKEAM